VDGPLAGRLLADRALIRQQRSGVRMFESIKPPFLECHSMPSRLQR
jgi:hypothetical protein